MTFSYITFTSSSAPNGNVRVYATAITDIQYGGTYTVKVTATLQESYYNDPIINVNTQNTWTLTIVDPCNSATVNSFATSSLNVKINDM